ncbi:hypothetical protein Rvan_0376 [Rhodomicrobium vannielii ATCC 17100]|jgi:hypothetical protein|uniref:Uncharacterized protein n=1 Tax=Rhodomicrobium vannielii (strain ATCC 17100 / DSM 162 / LMG 4299 / NCIMB 10020 / ATH 3.1.1) TaxID=648757 RepID=E3I7P6_RHOVT|nr:hypothetical protein [Rhodomicrobium vannielii]ADP69662.1 hypothetical protein Rvan_0376 [Rhodomicrobium vannielii ATCC 17100]
MSYDDTLSNLLHAMRHGDKLVEQLLHGAHGSPFDPVSQVGLLDRATVSDRRFWTGAAIGAAAVLVAAAVRNKRTVTIMEDDPKAPLSDGEGRRRSNGRY